MAQQIKGLVTKLDDQSLTPGTLIREGENQPLQVVLWPPRSIVVHMAAINPSMWNQYSFCWWKKISWLVLSSKQDHVKSTNMYYFVTFKFFWRPIEINECYIWPYEDLPETPFEAWAMDSQSTFIVIPVEVLTGFIAWRITWSWFQDEFLRWDKIVLYLPGAWKSMLPYSAWI